MVLIILTKVRISHHLECLNSLLDEYSKKYENYVFIGDFKVNTSESSMKEFCSLNGLKSLINKPACYKNSEKPTCIDLTRFFPGTTKVDLFSKAIFALSDCLNL